MTERVMVARATRRRWERYTIYYSSKLVAVPVIAISVSQFNFYTVCIFIFLYFKFLIY